MKPEDQSKYFATQADNLSNDVAMAILEMPAEFSGVPQSRHDLLTKSALNARHGPEIAELADLEEAIAAVESAVETGRDEVRLEAGALDERKFNELAAPIEAKHDAPWLRRRKDKNGVEEVRVVDLDQGRERLPTRAKKSRMASSTATTTTTWKEEQHGHAKLRQMRDYRPQSTRRRIKLSCHAASYGRCGTRLTAQSTNRPGGQNNGSLTRRRQFRQNSVCGEVQSQAEH